jgi:hypothetical protein
MIGIDSTTLKGDRFQTGTGDRTRVSSHKIDLQRFLVLGELRVNQN